MSYLDQQLFSWRQHGLYVWLQWLLFLQNVLLVGLYFGGHKTQSPNLLRIEDQGYPANYLEVEDKGGVVAGTQ